MGMATRAQTMRANKTLAKLQTQCAGRASA